MRHFNQASPSPWGLQIINHYKLFNRQVRFNLSYFRISLVQEVSTVRICCRKTYLLYSIEIEIVLLAPKIELDLMFSQIRFFGVQRSGNHLPFLDIGAFGLKAAGFPQIMKRLVAILSASSRWHDYEQCEATKRVRLTKND